jgi:hypothetical protein
MGTIMENKEVRISVDMNGNIHREFIDRPQPEVSKPRFIKRIVSTLKT